MKNIVRKTLFMALLFSVVVPAIVRSGEMTDDEVAEKKGEKRPAEQNLKELDEETRTKKAKTSGLDLLPQSKKDELLRTAIIENDVSMVEKALHANANPKQNLKGNSLLAFIAHDWYGVEYCNSNDYNRERHAAHLKNYPKIAKLLIAAVDVNSKNQLKETPLIGAVVNTYGYFFNNNPHYDEKIYEDYLATKYKIIELLLENKADPNLVNSFGSSPLHEVFAWYDINGMSEQFRSKYLYEIAEQVKLLLKYKANPNIQNEKNATPVHVNSFANNYPVLQLLLEANGSPTESDWEGFSPLHLAAQQNNIGCCFLLSQYGANFDQETPEGETALSMSSKLRDCVRELNSDGMENNQFLLACKYPNSSRVKKLIAENANINQVNNKGETGLMLAVKTAQEFPKMRQNGLEVIDTLLEAGADTTKKTNDYRNVFGFVTDLEINKKIKNHNLKLKREKVRAMLAKTMESGEERIADLILEHAGTYEPIN